jgi:hypothetical protein
LNLDWSQIESVKVRIVDHVLIKFIGWFGGFFRYNHLGYSVFSEGFYDKIEINGISYWIFIKRRSELERFSESINFLKLHVQIEVEEVKYGIKDLF